MEGPIQGAGDGLPVVADVVAGRFLRRPLGPRSGVHQDDPAAVDGDGQEGPAGQADPVLVVDLFVSGPEHLGDDAERGPAVEPERSRLDGDDLVVADRYHEVVPVWESPDVTPATIT